MLLSQIHPITHGSDVLDDLKCSECIWRSTTVEMVSFCKRRNPHLATVYVTQKWVVLNSN